MVWGVGLGSWATRFARGEGEFEGRVWGLGRLASLEARAGSGARSGAGLWGWSLGLGMGGWVDEFVVVAWGR